MSIETAMGKRVKQARESKSYSIGQLAERMAVTKKTIKKWEQGKSKPRANSLQMLSGILNVRLAWLIDGSEQFNPCEHGLSATEIIEQKTERTITLQQELARLNAEIVSDIKALQRDARASDLQIESFDQF